MRAVERIKSLIANASTIPSSEDIGRLDPIWEHVAPLVVNKEVLGTATFIAPGMALTAAHVLNQLSRREKPLAPGEIKYSGTSLLTYAARSSGAHTETQLMLAGVPSFYSDVAFLNLRATSGPAGPSERLTLTVSPPAVGSTVVAFGRPNKYLADSHLGAKCIRIISRVVELHHIGRDQRLPFACFRTDHDFAGGMSGGPVFNADGHVCGLVCSGAVEPYVALLWPAFGSIIGHDHTGTPLTSPIPVLDWLDHAQVPVHDRHKLTITEDGIPIYHHGLGTKESPLPVE